MLVTFGGEQITLPDFLIVGAAKSGTTSLYHYLKQHPKIFMPTNKEPRFFYNKNIQQNNKYFAGKEAIFKIEDYINLFKDAKEDQMIGEASPNYLYRYDTVIPNLKDVYGEKYKELKIIAILRKPVDRAYSHWLFFKKLGNENLDFMEAIERRKTTKQGMDYIKQGMYYDMVNAYLKEFPYVKIYTFEDLTEDTARLIKDLFNFLSVDPNYEVKHDVVINPSGIPKLKMIVKIINKLNKYFKFIIPDKYRLKFIVYRDNIFKKILYKPKIDDSTKKVLNDIYKEDIVKLQNLINRNLKHWLDTNK